MITDLISRLTADRSDGEEFSREICERIDAHIENYSSHIRDLEVLKAWVKDTVRVRSDAISSIIGPVEPVEPKAPTLPDTIPVVVFMEKKEAADA